MIYIITMTNLTIIARNDTWRYHYGKNDAWRYHFEWNDRVLSQNPISATRAELNGEFFHFERLDAKALELVWHFQDNIFEKRTFFEMLLQFILKARLVRRTLFPPPCQESSLIWSKMCTVLSFTLPIHCRSFILIVRSLLLLKGNSICSKLKRSCFAYEPFT